jgi:hypothetical protein
MENHHHQGRRPPLEPHTSASSAAHRSDRPARITSAERAICAACSMSSPVSSLMTELSLLSGFTGRCPAVFGCGRPRRSMPRFVADLAWSPRHLRSMTARGSVRGTRPRTDHAEFAVLTVWKTRLEGACGCGECRGPGASRTGNAAVERPGSGAGRDVLDPEALARLRQGRSRPNLIVGTGHAGN